MPHSDPGLTRGPATGSERKGVTLVAIPHAGGWGTFFSPLADHLPADVRLLEVDLSGHGRRRHAPLLGSIEAMARDLLRLLRPQLLRPYALLGHSMGALVAYQLLRGIMAQHLPLPRRIFVSSCPAPNRNRLSAAVAQLPAEEFWQRVAHFDGLPPRLFDHPRLMALFEPIFRADFRAVASFRPCVPAELPPIPIRVLYGREDPIASEALAAWQAWTSQSVTLHPFPGGHFYLIGQLSQVATLLAAQCRACGQNRDGEGNACGGQRATPMGKPSADLR